MMNRRWIAVLSVCLGMGGPFGSSIVTAQEAASNAPLSDTMASLELELDAFREGLFAAFNAGDYESMLKKYCHEDIITTWQDGTSGKGHEGVLAEFEKLSEFIDKMSAHPVTDMRLVLNEGDTVIATGDMKDEYALSRGMDVELDSRWTATLIKEEGEWLMVSFAVSTNAFDNEVVSLYLQNAQLTSAAIAIPSGLVLGAGIVLIWMRRRKKA